MTSAHTTELQLLARGHSSGARDEREVAVVPANRRSNNPNGIASRDDIAATCRAIDPCADPEWDRMLLQFPAATPFHTAGWARTLKAAYGYTPRYMVFGSPSAPDAVVPTFEIRAPFAAPRAVSLPFTDCCEPLLAIRNPQTSNLPASATTWTSSFSSIIPGLRSLELRGGDAIFSGVMPFSQHVTHELDLSAGQDELWNRCFKSSQGAVKKARRVGVTVSKSSSGKAIRAFYDLQCRTRRKHGLPPQPLSFFESLRRNILDFGLGSLYIAQLDGRPVAGALFLHFGKSVIYKYSASHEDYLQTCANNLVMWQAIADYADAGFQNLNFGRTETENSGLRRYKLSYGSTERPLNYYCFSYATNSFVQSAGAGKLLRIAQPVFRRLPLPLARGIGSLLYRYAG